jgi:hypothetical protein
MIGKCRSKADDGSMDIYKPFVCISFKVTKLIQSWFYLYEYFLFYGFANFAGMNSCFDLSRLKLQT